MACNATVQYNARQLNHSDVVKMEHVNAICRQHGILTIIHVTCALADLRRETAYLVVCNALFLFHIKSLRFFRKLIKLIEKFPL